MAVIETTVEGLGYAFVEAAWAAAGLLRVTIDRLDDEAVTVDDCEKVTRQLQYALEVEGVDYQRLEVSSPGLDRLLRRPEDFVRFAGLAVDVSLRLPFQGRKKYRGVLQQPEPAAEGQPQQYAIAWDQHWLDELAATRPGAARLTPAAARAAAKKAATQRAQTDCLQELRFSLAEAREVRLVPVLDFRGKKS